MDERKNHIARASDWRSAARRAREARAEELVLPSGATILAVKPEPLEWILAGRVPQRLLAAALGESESHRRESTPRHPRGSGDPPLDSRLRGNEQGSGHPASDSRESLPSGFPPARERQGGGNDDGEAGAGMTREDVLELARFAAQLVKASVVRPAIGDGPDEIPLDDIPIEDRAFIFEWACRALRSSNAQSTEEDLSSEKLERFCAQ